MGGLTMTEDQEVQDLVERFRVLLGLEPWDQYKERVSKRNDAYRIELGGQFDRWRGIGITTKGLLTAIAECYFRNIPSLLIGGRGDSNKRYCLALASDMVSGIGLNIRVGLVPLKGLRHLTYLDHWQPGGLP